MKIFLGIDIAKLNHFAAAISSDSEIILEPSNSQTTLMASNLLISKLDSFDKNSIIIGLESTAHYDDNLVRYLVTEFYQVCVLNPIKTCQMRKNNIRKIKTNKANKLLTFAGLNPSVYHSGNFQAKTTRMSKRGSRVLRYALINAAWNVVRSNATFKTYYDAKRAEGRMHYNTLGIVSASLSESSGRCSLTM